MFRRLTYANVVSSLALFVALGGTSYAVTKLAKNSVGNPQLQANAVTSDKIRDGAVAAADLAPGVVQSGPRGPRGVEGATGPAGPGVGGPEPWKGLPFLSGWGNYGDPFQAAQYRKNQLGMVELRGLITRDPGTEAEQPLIATLPSGYRPLALRAFRTASGQPDGPGRVDVYPDGTVRFVAGGANEKDFTSLEGITFDTN